MDVLQLDWRQLGWSLSELVVAGLLGLIIDAVLHAIARRIADRTDNIIDNSLVRHGHRPLRWIFPLLAAFLAMPLLPFPAGIGGPLRHALGLALIACLAWLLISLTDVIDDLVSDKYCLDVADNLEARRVHTQIAVLRRIAVILVGIVTLSIMLMTFPSIREVGATLFASAGLAGLVAGMAARPALANLIAGVQIALSRPIRLDDVVIVEGEWGWIEEITTTFVVVRIWDQRRLVVPLSYFMEKPFQNWTRQTADILGTAFVYTDYSVPVDEVRQELHRILELSDDWDGKAWGLQVTDATEHTMKLRAIMSTADSGKAWNLRCHVREELIKFLQQRFPESLPKTRAVLEGPRPGGGPRPEETGADIGA